MKIIVIITVSVKRGCLPQLMGELIDHGCDIQKIVRTGSASDSDVFDLEIVYADEERYKLAIDAIGAPKGPFQVLGIKNILEDSITGGLLRLSGKLPIENENDYEMRVLGSASMIVERISRGEWKRFSGITRNVGLVSALKKKTDLSPEAIHTNYTALERESITLQYFSGYNGLPLLVQYRQIEDLIKCIQSIDGTYSAVHFHHIEDVDDITPYEQLISDMAVTVTGSAYDTVPLCLATELLQLFDKYKMDFSDSNIGIIGINISSLRITRLLLSLGCLRVLGYDNNEKLMLTLEKAGGMATTPENIFDNTDVILLFKNHYTVDEFHKIRSGQIIISLIEEEEFERKIIKDKGIRAYLPKSSINASIFLPGLVRGMLGCDLQTINDAQLLELAGKLKTLKGRKASALSFFSDIHDRIAQFIGEQNP